MFNYLTKKILDPGLLRNAANDNFATQDKGVFLSWMGHALQRWQRHRMTRALERLDDHMLADIGIYRGDIPRVVEGFDARELRMVPLAAPSRPVEEDCCAFQEAA